jgi:hypothetical protein
VDRNEPGSTNLPSEVKMWEKLDPSKKLTTVEKLVIKGIAFFNELSAKGIVVPCSFKKRGYFYYKFKFDEYEEFASEASSLTQREEFDKNLERRVLNFLNKFEENGSGGNITFTPLPRLIFENNPTLGKEIRLILEKNSEIWDLKEAINNKEIKIFYTEKDLVYYTTKESTLPSKYFVEYYNAELNTTSENFKFRACRDFGVEKNCLLIGEIKSKFYAEDTISKGKKIINSTQLMREMPERNAEYAKMLIKDGLIPKFVKIVNILMINSDDSKEYLAASNQVRLVWVNNQNLLNFAEERVKILQMQMEELKIQKEEQKMSAEEKLLKLEQEKEDYKIKYETLFKEKEELAKEKENNKIKYENLNSTLPKKILEGKNAIKSESTEDLENDGLSDIIYY